tara:strand:+ start:78 stop:335 length:258 start_codon:yes stop_codon:yes gene_type:complete
MKIDCPFKQFSDIFGKPNTGIHKIKLGDTSIIDYFGTILGAMIISYYSEIPLVITTIVILIIGILFHLLFGVNTSSLKYLGIECN